MKKPEDIKLKIKLCEIEIKRLDGAYNKMCQIEMQSAEENSNRMMRNIMDGEKRALIWVLQ